MKKLIIAGVILAALATGTTHSVALTNLPQENIVPNIDTVPDSTPIPTDAPSDIPSDTPSSTPEATPQSTPSPTPEATPANSTNPNAAMGWTSPNTYVSN